MSSAMTKNHPEQPETPAAVPRRQLTAAARRALEEAAARRAATKSERPVPEINGRQGPDPVRFGDWEVNGIACDF
jgi:hypothetical protein